MTESIIDIVYAARLLFEKGEPLPVDLYIKLRNLGIDPDKMAAHYDL